MSYVFKSNELKRKSEETKKKINPLSANPTKWSNIFKQFVGKLPTSFLSVFDHFVGLTLKGLNSWRNKFQILKRERKGYHQHLPPSVLIVLCFKVDEHVPVNLSLKVVSAAFLLVCFVCLKESTCETRKNAFYFTSKAPLVPKIINF